MAQAPSTFLQDSSPLGRCDLDEHGPL